MHVESSRYTEQLQELTSLRVMAKAALEADSPRQTAELRQELAEVRLRLLGAIDAAKGAEAERAVVEARVKELEHQHHMLKVERDELRRELERVEAARRFRGPGLLIGLAKRARRRLSGG